MGSHYLPAQERSLSSRVFGKKGLTPLAFTRECASEEQRDPAYSPPFVRSGRQVGASVACDQHLVFWFCYLGCPCWGHRPHLSSEPES